MTGKQGPETRIRRYREGDENAIVGVLEQVFGRWPAFDLPCPGSDHWKWRYLRFPDNADHVYVVESEGQVVGCLHHTPVRIKVGDQVVRAMLVGDIAMLEAFRGQRIIARFTNHERELRETTGEQFSFFETRNPFIIRRYKRMGYPVPIESRHLARINNASAHFSRRKERFGLLRSLAFRWLRLVGRLKYSNRGPAAESGIRVLPVETLDARFDRLWAGVSGHYRYIMERNRDFLEWRYLDPRGGGYIMLCAEEDDAVLGYIVLRVSRKTDSYRVGYIVDLMCLPGREDAARELLQAGLEKLDSSGANIVHCLVPRRHPYYRIYREADFVDTLEHTVVWMVKSGTSRPHFNTIKDAPPGSLYYSYGDIDTI